MKSTEMEIHNSKVTESAPQPNIQWETEMSSYTMYNKTQRLMKSLTSREQQLVMVLLVQLASSGMLQMVTTELLTLTTKATHLSTLAHLS